MSPDLRPAAGQDSVARAYDARAAEYREVAGDLGLMDPRDRELIRRWRDETPGRLLDAGCGPGHWTAFLHGDEGAEFGTGRDVEGIDLSAAFIHGARARYPHLSFHHGSFRTLPQASGTVGGVLAWYSVIHTPPTELPDVFAEFARVLAPGGSLLLGFFVGEPRAVFPHAVAPAFFWTAEALSPLLAAAGLELQWSETREREPGEISSRPHGALRALRP
ncbi:MULTISPECIES: class I SAM-dependent DNA methyltransferase [unclassified Microbacterium]|uniref:class I SAM-dependent DNA methyltransferase n=1 Tax=unclassified Microbacterium TaxID=2609290 RepID=UPI0025D90212|nr:MULTISPECIES: class I SAM-dependent methyltransferase [unclassified Microbacterium]